MLGPPASRLRLCLVALCTFLFLPLHLYLTSQRCREDFASHTSLVLLFLFFLLLLLPLFVFCFVFYLYSSTSTSSSFLLRHHRHHLLLSFLFLSRFFLLTSSRPLRRTLSRTHSLDLAPLLHHPRYDDSRRRLARLTTTTTEAAAGRPTPVAAFYSTSNGDPHSQRRGRALPALRVTCTTEPVERGSLRLDREVGKTRAR